MKYVVVDLKPLNTPAIINKFKDRVFNNQNEAWRAISPGESITIRKHDPHKQSYVYKTWTFRKMAHTWVTYDQGQTYICRNCSKVCGRDPNLVDPICKGK